MHARPPILPPLQSRPGRTALLPAVALALALILAALACLPALARASGLNQDGRYIDDEFGFSFLPPKGWKFTVSKTEECMVVAEAAKDESCKVYVCVSPRIEGLITMRDNYLNCEQIKEYVSGRLKGLNPECAPVHTWRLRAYQAKYLRMVRQGKGVVWQFVDQKFLIRGALMFTVTAYTLGPTPEAARKVYEQNIYFLSQAMESLYFR